MPDSRRRPNPMEDQLPPAPGATWNVHDIAREVLAEADEGEGDKLALRTLIGTVFKGRQEEEIRRDPDKLPPALPELSLHVFCLRGGAPDTDDDPVDKQSPHKQPEAYLVLEGSGEVVYGEPFSNKTADPTPPVVAGTGSVRRVRPGDLVFIPAATQHRFRPDPDGHLSLLVIFAPNYAGYDKPS